MSDELKEIIETVDKLNEVYVDVSMEEEGLGFCLVYHPCYQWIGFGSDLHLWCSESDDRETDEETGEYIEPLYDYCAREYRRLVCMMYGVKNEG